MRTYSKEEQFCKTRGKNTLIKNLYYKDNKKMEEIAIILGTTTASIVRAFKRFGFKAKTDGKFKKMKNILGTNRLYINFTVPKNEINKHTFKGNRQTYLHRYLMENKLGRKLIKGEVIHHIDGNPKNNNVSNLKLCASHGRHVIDNNHYKI